MDRHQTKRLIVLAAFGVLGLHVVGCASDADPDLATESSTLTSRTAAAASEGVATTTTSSTASGQTKAATSNVVATASPPTTAAPPPATLIPTAAPPIGRVGQAIDSGPIRSGSVLTESQPYVCPTSFDSSQYPRYLTKFNSTWSDTLPAAINNLGQVVGSFRPTAGAKLKGFVRQVNGTFGPAPWYGPDSDVILTGINDLGQFIGYVGDINGDPYGFFDSHGVTMEGYVPLAINNGGQVVGIHKYSTWEGLFDYTDGFVRDANGVFKNLGSFHPVAINNVGQIAGYYPAEDSTIFDPGAIYRAGVLNPDGSFTFINYVDNLYEVQPVAMNDLGQVVGFSVDGQGHSHGVMANPSGALTSVDYPGHLFTQNHPTGINNLGQIVGWASSSDDVREQFVRDANGQFDLFEPAGPNGTNIDDGKDINDLGQEVGSYNDGTPIKGFVSGPVFVEPFAAFSVSKADIVPSSGGLRVWSTSIACAGRTLNPAKDPVLVKVYQVGKAWASLAIPAGSFVAQTGKYEYHGVLHGVQVDAYFWGPLADNHWDFRLYAAGMTGLPAANPVTVSVAFGDNTGSTTVTNATIH